MQRMAEAPTRINKPYFIHYFLPILIIGWMAFAIKYLEEIGIIGLILYSMLILYLFSKLMLMWLNTSTHEQRILVGILMGMFVGIFLHLFLKLGGSHQVHRKAFIFGY